MSVLKRSYKLALCLGFVVPSSCIWAIDLGTLDTFESGSQIGWVGGSAPQVVPVGVGGSSNSLQITATGRSLATYNQDLRWTGNYPSAGVTGIRAWMRNNGPQTVSMRLVVFNGSFLRWTSSSPFSLLPNSGWQLCTFPVTQEQMTLVLGSEPWSTTVANIDRIMFRHDPGTPDAGGTEVNAQVLIDNIEATGAPSASISGSLTLLDTIGLGGTESLGWTLSNTASSNSGSISVADQGSSQYSFNVPSNVLPGTYTLRMKGGTFLAKSITVLHTGTSVLGANFALVNGDIDQDGEIGPSDFDAVVGQFGGTGLADCDNDGEVGPSDFDLVVANFGLGDQ